MSYIELTESIISFVIVFCVFCINIYWLRVQNMEVETNKIIDVLFLLFNPVLFISCVSYGYFSFMGLLYTMLILLSIGLNSLAIININLYKKPDKRGKK